MKAETCYFVQAVASLASLCWDLPQHPAPLSSCLNIPFLLAHCCRCSCVQLCLLQSGFTGCLLGWSLDLHYSQPCMQTCFLSGPWTHMIWQPCPWHCPAATPGCTRWMDHRPSSIPMTGTVGGLWPYHLPGSSKSGGLPCCWRCWWSLLFVMGFL